MAGLAQLAKLLCKSQECTITRTVANVGLLNTEAFTDSFHSLPQNVVVNVCEMRAAEERDAAIALYALTRQ